MKTPRLYVDESELSIGREIQLQQDAAKYLIRVLRRSAGDNVTLFNGDGYNYLTVLNEAGKHVSVTITEKQLNNSESPLAITLVQSLAKGTKLDLVIQKATELGVCRIIPAIAERSVMQIDTSRQQKKMTHWQSVAISACTQCGRSKLPTIEAPASLSSCFNLAATTGLLLHPSGKSSIAKVSVPTQKCTLFIGPEGGFSDDELTNAVQAGVQTVTCGPRVLRTETAGFSAISILQARFGDL